MKKIFSYPGKNTTIELFQRTGFYFDGMHKIAKNLENIQKVDYLSVGNRCGGGYVYIEFFGKIISANIYEYKNVPEEFKSGLEQHIKNADGKIDERYLIISCEDIQKNTNYNEYPEYSINELSSIL